MFEEVWFAWGAENDEIQVPKKSAETGGHRMFLPLFSICKHLYLAFCTRVYKELSIRQLQFSSSSVLVLFQPPFSS